MPQQLPPHWFTEAISFPFRRRELTVAGCTIRYLAWGDPDKAPLVLVHGGAAHATWWSVHARELARQYYVIAPDLSGHGDSGRRDTYSMETWAEEVLAVGEDAASGKASVLVGHSMGGLVSIVAAAVCSAERLAGAIIVDSPVFRPDPESVEGTDGTAFRNLNTYPDLETALGRFRLIPEQPCEHRYILDHIARHSLRQTAQGWSWKFDPKVVARLSKTSMRDYLTRVRCRIALMRGEFSAIVPPETGENIYELLNRNVPLVEIPWAHHHLILDQPLPFIAALRALLADWGHPASRL
jgi:pimeloyl-ACP methyl ester carboxylesterase